MDGELTFTLSVDNLEVLGIARAFSGAYETDDFRMAFGGGILARASEAVAFAGDVTTLTNRGDDEYLAWGVGLQLDIPRSPLTISIQATNTASATMHGSSRGNDTVYWAFEFTTPLTFLGGD